MRRRFLSLPKRAQKADNAKQKNARVRLCFLARITQGDLARLNADSIEQAGEEFIALTNEIEMSNLAFRSTRGPYCAMEFGDARQDRHISSPGDYALSRSGAASGCSVHSFECAQRKGMRAGV